MAHAWLLWAATLLDHAVFADPEHAGASALHADTLEQLAYGSENATWRNFFLSGAMELRTGNFGTATQTTSVSLRLLSFAAGDNDSPGLEVAGDADALQSLLAVLDRPDPNFNIVTP